MTSNVPWSVKGIDPQARETAKELARQSGMTLGQWISSRIRQEQEEALKLVSPPVADLAQRRAANATKGNQSFEKLAARIEQVEQRSTQAVSGIDQFVRGALSRLETAAPAGVNAALEDRVRKLEAQASGPRSAEALKGLETALGRVASHLQNGETKTQATLDELRQRMENLENGSGTLADKVAGNIGKRLDEAEARTTSALNSLRDSFAQLDRRLSTAESRIGAEDGAGASIAVERRLEELAANLTQGVDSVRAEMVERLRETADTRFAQVDRSLAEMTGHVQEAERRSAQAIERMGAEVLRIAESMGRRVQAVEQRSADAIDRIGSDFSRAFDNLDARLQRSESAQAEALERLGGEIARITEKFSERIGASERRAAQAIDDVGAKVAEVSDRLGKRSEHSSSELVERIRQSEERTARMLSEARDRIDQRLGAWPWKTQETAPVAPFTDLVSPEPAISAEPESFDPPPFGVVSFDEPQTDANLSESTAGAAAFDIADFEAPVLEPASFDDPELETDTLEAAASEQDSADEVFTDEDLAEAVSTGEALADAADDDGDDTIDQARSLAERFSASATIYHEPATFSDPFAPAGLEPADLEDDRSPAEKAFYRDFAFAFGADSLPAEADEDAEAATDLEAASDEETSTEIEALQPESALDAATTEEEVYVWFDADPPGTFALPEAVLEAQTVTEEQAADDPSVVAADELSTDFDAAAAEETRFDDGAESLLANVSPEDDVDAPPVVFADSQGAPFAPADFDPVERAFARLDPSFREAEASEADAYGAPNSLTDEIDAPQFDEAARVDDEMFEVHSRTGYSEPVRPLTTRELIEQARAAARAAGEDSLMNRRFGEQTASFGGVRRRRGGMTNALLISSTAAALTVSIAGYVLLSGDGLNKTKLRTTGATAVAQAPATPRAAVALNPEPIDTAAAFVPSQVDQGAARLYTDAVQKIENDNEAAGLGPLREAANLGYGPAQFYLGKLYETGEAGVPKDMMEARRWTERAAVAGDRKAMHNLALYFFEGSGGPKNPAAAGVWFHRAAELGLTDSQYNLGRLYEEGLGVSQNAAEAYKWYVIAARAGDSEGRAAAQRLRGKLSPQAVAAADKAATAFAPQPVNGSVQIAAQAGVDVMAAQQALMRMGYYKGVTNGSWSPAMKMAVQAFQRDQNLPVTGMVDEVTLAKLSPYSR